MTNITNEQIEQAQAGFEAGGDAGAVELCEQALAGDGAARSELGRIVTLFGFEALTAGGQWSRAAAGQQDATNLFGSVEAARAEIPRLARALECDVSELRVVRW